MNFDINTPEGMNNSKQWLKSHLLHIRQGGTWIVPRSMTVIDVDHANKRAMVRMQMVPDESLGTVFKAIGWSYYQEGELQ